MLFLNPENVATFKNIYFIDSAIIWFVYKFNRDLFNVELCNVFRRIPGLLFYTTIKTPEGLIS